MGSPYLERLGPYEPPGLGAVAIETGTCLGYGAEALAARFRRVISIELSDDLATRARQRLAHLTEVEVVQGHSPERLAALLPTLSDRDPIFFFLDAHWSGDRAVPWRESKWKGYGLDTAHRAPAGRAPSGPEQCPLEEEVTVIARECRAAALLLIDDAANIGQRDRGFPGEDWRHISREKLLAAVGGRMENFWVLERPAQWLLRLSPLPRKGKVNS